MPKVCLFALLKSAKMETIGSKSLCVFSIFAVVSKLWQNRRAGFCVVFKTLSAAADADYS